jgi:hypothetical protein
LCLAGVLLAALTGQARSATTFTNSAPIAISDPNSSQGSQIAVSGFGGPPTSITVEVFGLSHNHVVNLGLVLVGPTGAAYVLEGACGSSLVSNISIFFSDTALTQLPTSALTSGTFKPTQYAAIGSFPPPGPGLAYQSPAPYGTQRLSLMLGLASPNGTWSLYAYDPVSGDSGQIANGWSLTIAAPPEPVPALPPGALWILGALLGVAAIRGARSYGVEPPS